MRVYRRKILFQVVAFIVNVCQTDVGFKHLYQSAYDALPVLDIVLLSSILVECNAK